MNCLKLLKKFVTNTRLDYLFDVKLAEGKRAVMLYPTYDLWLFEPQFKLLQQFARQLGEKNFFLTQFFDIERRKKRLFRTIKSHKLTTRTTYEEYLSVNLYSISVLLSVKGTWALLIDETFHDGYGIFISDSKTVEQFELLLKQLPPDNIQVEDREHYVKYQKYYEDLLKTNGILQ